MKIKKIAEKIEDSSIILSVAVIIQAVVFYSRDETRCRNGLELHYFHIELGILGLLSFIFIVTGITTVIMRKQHGRTISGLVLFSSASQL